MILENIKINNLGPFISAEVNVESDVTILTGRNDTGKSQLLKLLYVALSNKMIDVRDVNLQHFRSLEKDWQTDPNIFIETTFSLKNDYNQYLTGNTSGIKVDDKVKIKTRIARNSQDRNLCFRTDNKKSLGIKKFPKVIWMNDNIPLIQSRFDYSQVSGSEEKLLISAFGENYKSTLSKIPDDLTRRQILNNGGKILSQKFSKLLGRFISLDFSEINETELGLHLMDSQEYETPIDYRGAGLRKILTILAIISSEKADSYCLILYDEPENSLHADSQHRLRRFFEELSSSEKTQIIYATHSPMMMNTFYPNRVRLFERVIDIDKEEAQSIIRNNFLEKNLFPIINSLGVSPADSLLIAPITIITEGKTEVKNLGILLQKLHEEKIAGFEKVDLIAANSLIFNGEGCNFVKWVKLIKQQGGNPIIFLDGDKMRHINGILGPDWGEKYKVCHMERDKEFEDILPIGIYISALVEKHGESLSLLDLDNWYNVLSVNEKEKYHLTSKKIKGYLSYKGIEVYDKTEIFRIAIEKTDFTKIDRKSIEPLIDLIETCLEVMNF